MSERKEKVEKFSLREREKVGAFPWEENIGKIPTFSRGKKKYIIT